MKNKKPWFKHIWILTVLLVIQLSPPLIYPSKQKQWKALNESSIKHYEQKQLEPALTDARQALILSREVFGHKHINTAISLNNLGLIHQARGDFAKAEPLFIQAVQLTKDSPKPKAAEITSKPIENVDHIQCRYNLARLYDKQKRFNDAVAHYKQVLALSGQNPTLSPSKRAFIHQRMAEIYQARGDYLGAESHWEKAMAIYVNLKEDKGVNLNKAAISSQLGYIYTQLGKRKMSELYADLTQVKKLQIGSLYFNSAQFHLKKAISTKTHYLGEGHKKLSGDLCNLGTLYLTQAQSGLALLELGLKIENRTASMYYNQLRKAEWLLKEVLKIDGKHLGDRHPKIGGTLTILGDVLKELKEYKQAEDCYVRALDVRLKTVGGLHSDIASAYLELGRFYIMMNKEKKAEVNLQAALDICEKKIDTSFNDTSSTYLTAMFCLITIHEQDKKWDLAEPLHIKRVALLKRANGNLNQHVADQLVKTAQFFQRRKKYPQALQYYREALHIFDKLAIKDTFNYTLAAKNLPKVLKKIK